MWAGVMPGMSVPMRTSGPGGARSKSRCMRAPRSPPPWDTRGTVRGQRRLAAAMSGVTARVVDQRPSAPTRRSREARLWRAKRTAVATPSSAAIRVFTRPATGALAITIRRKRKGAARGALRLSECRRGRDLRFAGSIGTSGLDRHQGVAVAVLRDRARAGHAPVVAGGHDLVGDQSVEHLAPVCLGQVRIGVEDEVPAGVLHVE